MSLPSEEHYMQTRFRGYLPIIMDVETAGFNPLTDALLEVAAVSVQMDAQGWLLPMATCHFHVQPFEDAHLDPTALAFNGIDPYHPERQAVSEQKALSSLFQWVRNALQENHCHRAVITAHNATFDHHFLTAATARTGLKCNPFHPFTTFDTAALSGLVFGQTVLAKACNSAGITFDNAQAHSALYDAERTALLFCALVNRWKQLGGWPPNPLTP